MFGNDAKLFCVITADTDIISLLTELVQWCDAWQVHFNVAKCKAMSLGNATSTRLFMLSSL